MHAPAEEVEAAEDERLAEVELLPLGEGQERILRGAVLLLVRLVQLDAGLQILDQGQGVLAPQRVRLFALQDALFAVRDHLVRDLREQVRHALGRVVIPRDRVDHLDGIHQRREGVDDRRRGADVQRLDELLQRREVLHVVLGLVESLRDLDVDLLPPAQRVEDCLAGLVRRDVLADPGDGLEQAEHHLPLLGPQLLRYRRDLLQPVAPELQLRAGPRVAGLLLLALQRLLEVLLNLPAPILEQFLVFLHQLGVVLGDVVVRQRPQVDVRRLRAFQVDAAAQGLDALGQVCREAVEIGAELGGLLAVARGPVHAGRVVHERPEHVHEPSV
mmetsp:Transcript_39915/g.120574  ORF Transcript_39915/g.120574 Transcript_39915/m.120574 type:complete len:330 (+) Transcript_39915:10859-11848(+)